MIWVFVIIGAIITVVWFLCEMSDFGIDASDIGTSILLGILGGFIGALVGFIVSAAVCSSYASAPDFRSKYEVQSEQQIELLSMKDNFGIEGNFYLFGGHIDNDLNYIFMTQDPTTKRISVQKKEVDKNTYLNTIADTEQPYLKITTYVCKDGWMNFFTSWFVEHRQEYDFYVPQSGVYQGVNIDLE